MHSSLLPPSVVAILLVALGAASLDAADDDQAWRSLFDGQRLGDWEAVEQMDFVNHGDVEVRDRAIHIGRGQPGTAIRYTEPLPTVNYELRLEAKRVEGDDFFSSITFPIGEEALTLIIGGWGGPVVGLSCIDGEPAAENETCYLKDFVPDRWYRVRLRVTGHAVEVWIDHDKVIHFVHEQRDLSLWFDRDTTLPLSICTWRTGGAVRDIQLREVDPDRIDVADDAVGVIGRQSTRPSVELTRVPGNAMTLLARVDGSREEAGPLAWVGPASAPRVRLVRTRTAEGPRLIGRVCTEETASGYGVSALLSSKTDRHPAMCDVILRYNGAWIDLIVDGQQVQRIDARGSLADSADRPWRLTRLGADQSDRAAIGYVAVWDRALADDEIATLTDDGAADDRD